MPRIGRMRLQAVRPSMITKLYRDLLTSGGRDGRPLAVPTVTHLHAVLRKAFRDAVDVDELLASQSGRTSQTATEQAQEPGTVWTVAQLRAFLDTARHHRLFAFYRLAAYTGARRGELLYLRWSAVDLDARDHLPDQQPWSAASAWKAPPRAAGPARSASTATPWRSSASTGQTGRRTAPGRVAWSGTGGLVFTTGWGEPLYPDTVTALMTKLINQHNKSDTPPAEPAPPRPAARSRHLHATTLLLAGVPVHVVAARLGHADPAVTLRVYSHVIREHAAGVGDIFAQAVNAA